MWQVECCSSSTQVISGGQIADWFHLYKCCAFSGAHTAAWHSWRGLGVASVSCWFVVGWCGVLQSLEGE